MKASVDTCPCGSGIPLADCCGRYHAGVAAPNAEKLMRSRYSAYVLGREDYLFATWHIDTRPAALNLNAAPRAQWLGLTVEACAEQDAEHATVQFTARYKLNGRAFRLHETSRFVRIEGHWLYVDGEVGE